MLSRTLYVPAMMQTTCPAVGRLMAARRESGLEVDRPELPLLPFVAAYQVHGGWTAATPGTSASVGAGVPAGAVGSTGGTSASAIGACRARRLSDTMVQRRKLVIMVDTSLVALPIDERGRPWTTRHCAVTGDGPAREIPPEKAWGDRGVGPVVLPVEKVVATAARGNRSPGRSSSFLTEARRLASVDLDRERAARLRA